MFNPLIWGLEDKKRDLVDGVLYQIWGLCLPDIYSFSLSIPDP